MILNIVIILNTVFVIGIMITVAIIVNVTPGQPDLTCIAMLSHRRLKFKYIFLNNYLGQCYILICSTTVD